MSILSNQKGNIVVGLALAVVGLIAALSITLLIVMDTMSTRVDRIKMQQVNLLRSECERAKYIIEHLTSIPEDIIIPSRHLEITGYNTSEKYLMQTRIKLCNPEEGTLFENHVYKILSMASIDNSIKEVGSYQHQYSSVKSYCENRVRRETLAGYHYISNKESSSNDTNVYFWGPDVIYGRVHSNSDIWLKQDGGGENNGWPTFFGRVTTAGQINSISGLIPTNRVFMAGYWEHVTPIEFNLTAETIRANGIIIGPGNPDPNRILFVTANGSGYTSMIGNVVYAGDDTVDVWTQYPPGTGDYLFRNVYPHYDTLWTQGPTGSIVNHSAFITSKLWLKGRFGGAQTWCSADTVYLMDDCTLQNTVTGSNPDGTDGSMINNSDILGIVSEKSILVGYGYKDPQTLERQRPNCNNIWIYAALCALGEGNGNSRKDGVFSFQYQHPHPSIPDTRLPNSNVVWSKIDLHRRAYPQTQNAPWLSAIDYPFYNPLWPESNPYAERGIIHLRGAVAQRRRGYVHRGAVDSEYPNLYSAWNIPMDFCGSNAGNSITDAILNRTFSCVNIEGATNRGVGYSKNYVYDSRFDFNAPPDFPELFLPGRRAVYNDEGWIFKQPPQNF